MEVTLSTIKKVQGCPLLLGDKSLSHRALIFAAMSYGQSTIEGLLLSEDVLSTWRCLEQLGVEIRKQDKIVIVEGNGVESFVKPSAPLDCGNSGTTMRLMMGVLARCPFETILIGDESLSKRPMGRVAKPLELMGAKIELEKEKFAPVKIVGGKLNPIEFELIHASAQVKTAIMLAALGTEGESKLFGKLKSRDHTERMLPHFGVNLQVSDHSICVLGPQKMKGKRIVVPKDPSSAAFFMAMALMHPGSSVEFEDISLNPTRLGFVDVIKEMGAKIETEIKEEFPEKIGKLKVSYAPLKGIKVDKDKIPFLIDEIPILCVLATTANGVTHICDAKDLRVKESDRIESTASNLLAMGIEVETFEDGLKIKGPQKLMEARIKTYHDHRIAMAFAVAALKAEGKTVIEDAEVANVSFPGFYETLQGLCHV